MITAVIVTFSEYSIPIDVESPGDLGKIQELNRSVKLREFCWWSGRNSMYCQIEQLLL